MEGKFKSNSGQMCWCSGASYHALGRDRLDQGEGWERLLGELSSDETAAWSLGEAFAGLGLNSGTCRYVVHRSNPMVYLFLAGSEADLGYLAESTTVDDFTAIDGVRLDCSNGAMVAFDPSSSGRPLARVTVPPGTYLPFQIRQHGEDGEAWMVVLFEEAFAERMFE